MSAQKRNLQPERHIVSVLFSDVAGYSKLTEPQLRVFLEHVLPTISNMLAKDRDNIIELNTWGDAIVVVSADPYFIARFAFELRDYYRDTPWEEFHLPDNLGCRISLNTGVVFIGSDPIRQKQGILGAHMNLTARIEQITPVGEIFTTENFKHLIDRPDKHRIAFDDVGHRSLPKDYGACHLFRVRRPREIQWRDTPPDGDMAPTPTFHSERQVLSELGVLKTLISKWRDEVGEALQGQRGTIPQSDPERRKVEQSIEESILKPRIRRLIKMEPIRAETEAKRLLNTKPQDVASKETYIAVLLKDANTDGEKLKEAWDLLTNSELDNVALYLNFGYRFWELGDLERAIEALKSALIIAEHKESQKEEMLKIKANLAYYLADTGRDENEKLAREYAKTAYNADPNRPSRMDTLGYILIVFGRIKKEVQKGMELCFKAYELDPSAAKFFEKHISLAIKRIAEMERATVAKAGQKKPLPHN
jgi:class 3 adenylate cyclase/tetratricopeptide (TPR) repeat protein